MSVCVCRSWQNCWMKRSWAASQCWSLQTSRTCWQPPRPLRSLRASICTPSGIACGRSSPAPPSLVRGSRWAYKLSFFLFIFMPHYSPLLTTLLFFLNSLSGGHELGLQERQLQEKIASLLVFFYSGGTAAAAAAHTHTLTHIAPSWALVRWDIPVNVNTLLIQHGLGVFNPLHTCIADVY